jgi:sugar phosphate isomerase/epimerase
MTLLDETDASAILAISRNELRQLVRSRRVPVVAIPVEKECIRFDERDLARAVEQWKRPAVPSAGA